MKRKLFYNCTVITMDEKECMSECMLVDGEDIIYTGVLDFAPCEVPFEVIDLKGNTIMPSFIDAHLHFGMAADTYFGLDLTACESVQEYQNALKQYIDEHPEASVIKGFGWHDRHFDERGPDKKILDEICPDIPAVLLSDSGHSFWVNSATLRTAQIDRDTKEVGKGYIEKYENGEPSGTVKEDCMVLVNEAVPDYTVEQYKEAFLDQIDFMNSLGFTGFNDSKLDAGSNAIEALKTLAEEKRLNGYMECVYFMYPFIDVETQIHGFVEARKNDNRTEGFSVNTVKLFLDGVIESRTAYLKEPYINNDKSDVNYRGTPVWEQDLLNKAVLLALKNGFQVETHCIGDAALDQALEAYEYAKGKGYLLNRSKIAHIELLSEGSLKRMKDLGIIPCLNPYWAGIDDLYYDMLDSIGTVRAEKIWPINSIVKTGLVCASGSDYPITEVPNPFVGIELGVRRVPSKYYHPWAVMRPFESYNRQLGPDEEKTELTDMIRMYTSGSAYSMFIEGITGRLEPGKHADFIITSKNIFDVDEEEISSIKVLATYFRGREVYHV